MVNAIPAASAKPGGITRVPGLSKSFSVRLQTLGSFTDRAHGIRQLNAFAVLARSRIAFFGADLGAVTAIDIGALFPAIDRRNASP